MHTVKPSITKIFFFADKLYKNIKVLPVNFPAAESLRTISAASQFLLPVSYDAADDIDNFIVNSNYHVDTISWRANYNCHQRCLRRLCML